MRPHFKHCLVVFSEKALVAAAHTVIPPQKGHAPRYITAKVPTTKAPEVKRANVAIHSRTAAIKHPDTSLTSISHPDRVMRAGHDSIVTSGSKVPRSHGDCSSGRDCREVCDSVVPPRPRVSCR